MEIWVITRGEYEDESIVGVVTSKREADLFEAAGEGLVFDDAISVHGPFKPGALDLLSLSSSR